MTAFLSVLEVKVEEGLLLLLPFNKWFKSWNFRRLNSKSKKIRKVKRISGSYFDTQHKCNFAQMQTPFAWMSIPRREIEDNNRLFYFLHNLEK